MGRKRKHAPIISRNDEKNVALNSKRAVSNRRELMEIDYLDKLSESEKEFLNKFNEEFIMANFEDKYNNREFLDDSAEARKKSYDANNSRNRCQYTKAKMTKLLDNTPTQEAFNAKLTPASIKAYNNIEDVLIDSIDRKQELLSKITKNTNKRTKKPD